VDRQNAARQWQEKWRANQGRFTPSFWTLSTAPRTTWTPRGSSAAARTDSETVPARSSSVTGRRGRPSGSGSGLALRRGLSPAPAVGAQHRDDVANDRVRVFERRPTGEDEPVGVLVDDENLALDTATFDHRILAFPTRRRPGRLQLLILRTLTPLDWFPRARTAELVPHNRAPEQSSNAGRNTRKPA
jgi:hypothetical protein